MSKRKNVKSQRESVRWAASGWFWHARPLPSHLPQLSSADRTTTSTSTQPPPAPLHARTVAPPRASLETTHHTWPHCQTPSHAPAHPTPQPQTAPNATGGADRYKDSPTDGALETSLAADNNSTHNGDERKRRVYISAVSATATIGHQYYCRARQCRRSPGPRSQSRFPQTLSSITAMAVSRARQTGRWRSRHR